MCHLHARQGYYIEKKAGQSESHGGMEWWKKSISTDYPCNLSISSQHRLDEFTLIPL